MIVSLSFIDMIVNEFFYNCPGFPAHIFDGITMIMPSFAYMDQIRLMLKTSCENYYSLQAALIILAANYLRILLWFFEPYAIPLFGQSVVLVIVELIHTFFHFYFKNKNTDVVPFIPQEDSKKYRNPKFVKLLRIQKSRNFKDFFISCLFYSSTATALFLILCLFFGVHIIVNFFSIFANLIYSAVTLPLFKKVVIDSDIELVTLFLPLQFVVADIMKFVILLVNRSPWPFYISFIVPFVANIITTTVFIIKSNKKLNNLHINMERKLNERDMEN